VSVGASARAICAAGCSRQTAPTKARLLSLKTIIAPVTDSSRATGSPHRPRARWTSNHRRTREPSVRMPRSGARPPGCRAGARPARPRSGSGPAAAGRRCPPAGVPSRRPAGGCAVHRARAPGGHGRPGRTPVAPAQCAATDRVDEMLAPPAGARVAGLPDAPGGARLLRRQHDGGPGLRALRRSTARVAATGRAGAGPGHRACGPSQAGLRARSSSACQTISAPLRPSRAINRPATRPTQRCSHTHQGRVDRIRTGASRPG
jgi:hypothetical protein